MDLWINSQKDKTNRRKESKRVYYVLIYPQSSTTQRLTDCLQCRPVLNFGIEVDSRHARFIIITRHNIRPKRVVPCSLFFIFFFSLLVVLSPDRGEPEVRCSSLVALKQDREATGHTPC